MSFEAGKNTGTWEKEPPLSEEIHDLELRVTKLVGGVEAKLDKTNIKELSETATGQSKLLQLHDSARRFNEKAQATVAALASSSFLTDALSKYASDPTLHGYAQLGYQTTATAALIAGFICLLRNNKFQDEVRGILDKLKTK